MKDGFAAYPELICLDATYKLLELGLPVYLMLCEDSNGQSELICVCLLVTEDSASMTWMLDTFKKRNPNWEKTRVVMSDKDIGEREVIKKCLPDVSLLICLFHTLRSFRREVTCEKMGITSGERTLCLELIQKMAYAKSHNEYERLHTQFQKDTPREVAEYFKDNWHPIADQWVLGMKFSSGSFLNSTNNRLESINGKLKQVISKNSSLEEFVIHFFIILGALRTERDHKAAIMFQKVRVNPFPEDSPESKYAQLLTSYASKFVLQQLSLVEKVKNVKEANGEFTIQSSEGLIVVNPLACGCLSNKAMALPCRHVFALRKKLGTPLFDANLCDERWTLSYYKSTQRLFSASTVSVSPVVISTVGSKHRRKLSQHQKFRKASIITSELASVTSEASNIHFQRRIELLEDLIAHWKSGDEVAIVEVEKGMFLTPLHACMGGYKGTI